MTTEAPVQPQAVHRLDYRPPAFWIDSVRLEFDLGEDGTEVRATLVVRRNPEHPEAGAALELIGEDLETLGVTVDGKALEAGDYTVAAEQLSIPGLPDTATIETRVRIHPETNTQLSGLYKSSGNFCTQCEAEGFRRITWFLDRPDVMATYTVVVRADKAKYPVLLSNGNRMAERDLGDGRHEAEWEDPFKKPSYLFALVAGDLACKAGTFTTMTGREVQLEIWVEPHQIDKCEHALESLAESMRWDEQQFAREYDLDLYMIVAVDDFNMGAMENKGLNIFNSALVLASPQTATDDDYERIAGVVAHEYFHNWTGNRVTCRDWFQLTLKEGLTVFRDQRFTAEHTSEPVKRIEDVGLLRARQFPEDAGPMSHPIRPESYISMDNFYTATVYEKGAEVIRMYDTLLGRDGFRKGMDLYFERHDGAAVTCDDFRAAMADANGRDLTQFERWYSQAGTPRLVVNGEHDAARARFTLRIRQQVPEGQPEGDFLPLHVPLRLGLLGPDGTDLPLAFEGEDPTSAPRERLIELTDAETTLTFVGLAAAPVASLNRGFAAPVIVEYERRPENLAFQFANDSDAFNRWDAGQRLFGDWVLGAAEAIEGGAEPAVPAPIVEAFRAVVSDPGLDGSMRSLAMMVPSEGELAQRQEVIRPDSLRAARQLLRRTLARECRAELGRLWEANRPDGPYRATQEAIARRRAANAALGCAAFDGDERWLGIAAEHYRAADNMTDAQTALAILCQHDVPARTQALDDFYAKWKGEPNVLNKWFSLQSTSTLPGAAERVAALLEHPDFAWTNPNRVRSVVAAFAVTNLAGFHAANGSGYRLLSDAVLRLQDANPQIASRLVSSFNQWRRFDDARQAAMQAELERIAGVDGLSKDVFEIVQRALG
ncbi:MAG: aminopeptidase N [Planctomycetota bacterium]